MRNIDGSIWYEGIHGDKYCAADLPVPERFTFLEYYGEDSHSRIASLEMEIGELKERIAKLEKLLPVTP